MSTAFRGQAGKFSETRQFTFLNRAAGVYEPNELGVSYHSYWQDAVFAPTELFFQRLAITYRYHDQAYRLEPTKEDWQE